MFGLLAMNTMVAILIGIAVANVIRPGRHASLPPGEEERAMLDALFDREPTSRLGCQIRLAAALDGLRLRLPA